MEIFKGKEIITDLSTITIDLTGKVSAIFNNKKGYRSILGNSNVYLGSLENEHSELQCKHGLRSRVVKCSCGSHAHSYVAGSKDCNHILYICQSCGRLYVYECTYCEVREVITNQEIESGNHMGRFIILNNRNIYDGEFVITKFNSSAIYTEILAEAERIKNKIKELHPEEDLRTFVDSVIRCEHKYRVSYWYIAPNYRLSFIVYKKVK